MICCSDRQLTVGAVVRNVPEMYGPGGVPVVPQPIFIIREATRQEYEQELRGNGLAEIHLTVSLNYVDSLSRAWFYDISTD